MTSKNLIIQAHDIETHDLKSLHGLAHANAIEKIDGPFSHQAFRLTDVDAASMESVKTYCEPAKLDFAFVDSTTVLSDFKLIASDMDSTLITIECIDEMADYAGKKAEVAAVTEAAMRGELDWSASLRQRVLALAGLAVGLTAALAANRVLEGMLYGVQPVDSTTYFAVAAAILLITVLAALGPAWRATRVDPLVALRQE